jgi:hypothetical protein
MYNIKYMFESQHPNVALVMNLSLDSKEIHEQ